MLTENRIWKQRLIDVGIISAKDVKNWGLSGVLLRGSGINWDLRKSQPYEIYNKINFEIPTTFNGDCFDRYFIRIFEIKQSLNMCESLKININQFNKSFVYYFFNNTIIKQFIN
jgi:NADH-quinone oxidoreductase subunit D